MSESYSLLEARASLGDLVIRAQGGEPAVITRYGKPAAMITSVGETCKHCKKPIVRCEALPAHFGCSSACGYIHANGWAHACEARSDGPYAQPDD